MGMYDTVLIPCPNCKAEQDEQTKAGDCLLNVYNINVLPPDIADRFAGREFHCDQCGTEFALARNERRPPKTVALHAYVIEASDRDED